MNEPFSLDSLPAADTSRMPDDPEGRPASRRAMGGQEIDLQLKPERGECAALEIGCVSFPARARGQDHINEDYVGVMLGDLAARGRTLGADLYRCLLWACRHLAARRGRCACARGNTRLAASDRPRRPCTEPDGRVLCGADRAPRYWVSGGGRRCA